ncbi:helix-turn-helix domain-containing protein [Actinomadura sp. NPDC048032]|uniref:helix-turn-helix domain-containing protein n=1 Tax=Actinomadura sp. NPDC048032 TaxID=3155747 RepID=UPI0033FF6937
MPLSQALALYLRSRSSDLPERVLEDVWRSIPEIARASPHSSDHDARSTIDQKLRTFVRNIADPAKSPEDRARMHRALGRSAYLHGVSPALLQSAYQAGARFAWRRLAEATRRSGTTADHLYGVTEAVLTSAEDLSAHALASYTEMSQEGAESLHENRHRLLQIILAEQGTIAPSVLARAADAARWTDRLRCGLQGMRFAVGIRVDVAEATQSLHTAEQALSLLRQGTFPSTDHVRCDDHLSTLLLLNNEHLTRRLVEHHMAALERLEPEPRRRLFEILLAWLSTGSQAQAATPLHLQPQTVRYRMRRLDELFGDKLRDPAWRFEMELAIRAHR